MQDAGPGARVVSVNVGEIREVEWLGERFTTGIFKEPVEGRRRVEGVHVDGDQQADPNAHGGPTKSLYAYALEDYRWWEAELGRRLGAGTFGDNLTIAGMDPARAIVGERWRAGSATVRVTEPRIPCFKLGMRMGDRRFPARFAAAARPGTYLAIERAGDVGVGDTIEVLTRPAHGVTVGDVERAFHGDRSRVARLLDADELSGAWRGWAEKMLSSEPRDRTR